MTNVSKFMLLLNKESVGEYQTYSAIAEAIAPVLYPFFNKSGNDIIFAKESG